ncbi:MAG: Ferric iron ABC transporter, iron-binding protein [uncultured Acidimicrobiales bacterium]|uniref:Ferric iron ABC transporter, iron-binding protein n=1 Tax=uncultured Acidimicrobiales bacterium TaxID=310071 RepID=A0A6J4HSK7_9ACTN|nr:MAG: Ferric iron ABC transporter, iron-binding protein [uncultured Acidimicrobiales bacterium]
MRRTRQLLCILLAGVVLAGCGLGGGGDESAQRVTIYTGRTQNLIEPILERFAKETGIDVDVRYGQSSDLALLIDEEGGRTPADVFLSQTPSAVGYLDHKGRLGRLPDDVLSLVPPTARADDGSWVGFSGRKRVLVYNPAKVPAATLPRSVLDMTGPQWKGRVGIAPPNASFQDFVSAMRVKLGDDATSRWLKGMADNDAFTFANNTAIVAAVGRGEIDVGLVNHYYVLQAKAENPSFSALNHDFPSDDLGNLLIVTAASIVKGSKHTEEATALVRYLLQEDAQRYFSDQTYEYPLAAGVAPSSALPPMSFDQVEGVDFDRLGGDLESTRALIRAAGLEG